MWPTLRRLLTLWRGEWRSVALGLVCALAYTALSLAIPTLLQRAIDNLASVVFVNTVGDRDLRPRVLDAAERFKERPTDGAMTALVESSKTEPLFV